MIPGDDIAVLPPYVVMIPGDDIAAFFTIFSCKIKIFCRNLPQYLYISKKSSTFAVDNTFLTSAYHETV